MLKLISIPDILECSRIIAKSDNISKRIVKDYELDFYIDGKRKMRIDDCEYSIETGSLVFRKPGQIVESIGDYNCYIMTLDFTNKSEINPNQYTRTRLGEFQPLCSHELFDSFPSVFIPKHYQEIKELYRRIDANTYPFPENTGKAKLLLKELMFIISADIVETLSVDCKSTHSNDYIEGVYKYINNNYMNDIFIKDIAKKICINQNYLIRLFKEKTNMTPNQYLNEVRLFHARQMLIESSLKTSEIAIRCGYNNPSYFAECFKKKFFKTPTEYRKEIG